MNIKESRKGILIAFFGALLITPDTLFMDYLRWMFGQCYYGEVCKWE